MEKKTQDLKAPKKEVEKSQNTQKTVRKGKILLVSSVLLGFSLASTFLLTFYFGFIAKRISDEGYIPLALFGLIIPFLIILVANINELIKKIVLLASAALSITGSYFILLLVPNFILPDFQLDDLSLYMYFLTVGSSFILTMISFAEVARLAREEKSSLFMGISFLLSGLITGLVLFFTASAGWLYPMMIINYFVPTGILIYFWFYPEGKDGERSLRNIQTPETIAKYQISDTTKGLKLTFTTIIACFGIIGCIGVNGMGLTNEQLYTENWIFWIMAGVGGFLISIIAKFTVFRTTKKEASTSKTIKSQVQWILFIIIIALSVVLVYVVDYLIPGLHATIYSHVIDGILLGVIIASFLGIVIMQHPPRSTYAYYMMMMFFLVFSVAVGNYLKTLVGPDDFAEYGEYVLYIIAAGLILLILTIIAQAVTINKKRKEISR